MDLLIFDIDGTLTNTKWIDDHCFKLAFKETLGIEIDLDDWDCVEHATDFGISSELYLKANQRKITANEVDGLKSRFVELLGQYFRSDRRYFEEIPGATCFIEHIKMNHAMAVAMATGGWGASALLKLNAVGLNYENVPISNSDLFISREEIVLDAIANSKNWYATEFNKVVYFGDGVWDLRTCNNLCIPFIGVDHSQNGKLKKSGAKHVISDFRNYKAIVEMVSQI